jgi:hypothetical protein
MGVFVIFGNNLNGFGDFYHGTNVSAGLVHPRHQSYQLACTLSFAKHWEITRVLFGFLACSGLGFHTGNLDY